MQIYNTLGRRKEELKPRRPGEISMYVCGLTVYNFMHIGNARTFVNFDMIRRYLEYREFDVIFVRNITDVDDKIIKRAAEEGTTPEEIAKKYEAAFRNDTDRLGVKDPTIEPRATETIPAMIKLVEELIDRGLAYDRDGNVWFRVRGFEGYGKLSGRDPDDMRAGERVEPDPTKEDPMDFALWKKAKPGEPFWPSPWGDGRPGWHLECSAMSLKYLGPGFDIHGGAVDLIFPHHENEIAQSEGATGLPFVTYWVHGGLLNIDREKMSKSLGNVMLVGELLKQWPAAVVRMFMLGTHYRNPLDFTEAGLTQARANVAKIGRTLTNMDFAAGSRAKPDAESTRSLAAAVERAKTAFIEAMDDDFNSAEALPAVFGLIKEINTVIDDPEKLPEEGALLTARDTIIELTGAVGLKIEAEADIRILAEPLRELTAEVMEADPNGRSPGELIDALLARRKEARREKEWALADKIRDKLVKIGVEVEDTAAGSRWKLSAR